jgi:transposase
MGNGSGVSRGDRDRNARLGRLCALVPVTNVIAGIDLAGSRQMVVVTDHDSKVIARRVFRCRAWDLGSALDRAASRAAAAGWAGVTVSCEPAGHRWRVLGQLAADRLVPFVCVQPVVTSWSRRTEDLTCGKTDEKDAVLIARLTVQLRCYVPGPVDEAWGRLRHLGTRREQLITEAGGQIQQMRDLLECVWPAALDTARQPFRSGTWVAALPVIAGRDGGGFARTRRLGAARSGQAVRREITRRGGHKPCLRIVRGLFTALADPAGVIAHRPGALERVQFLLEDWEHSQDRLAETEQRMTAVLDELGLTGLVTSMTGLSAIGAAAILAETGGPRRFATARGGQACRPGPVGETVRRVHRPDPADRARTARAAAGRLARGLGSPARQPGLRRPLPVPDQQGTQQAHAHPGADRHRRSDLAAAACHYYHRTGLGPGHRDPRHPVGNHAKGRLTPVSGASSWRPGRALRGIEEHRLPRRSSSAAPSVVSSTRSRAAGTNPITAMQGQTTDEAPAKRLTQNDSR